MKKVIASVMMLAAVVALASCGGSKLSENCEKALTYNECTNKQGGMDEATLKTTMENTRKAYEVGGEEIEAACKAIVETSKTAPCGEKATSTEETKEETK